MGNACFAASNSTRDSVHPHVHGERRGVPGQSPSQIGSSPRTWGTQTAAAPTPAAPPVHPHVHGERGGPRRPGSTGRRFIPTYMGNARGQMPRFCSRTVHPHVHGERGVGQVQVGLQLRFIPTYMGNAIVIALPPRLEAVHPHVHGERFLSSPGRWLPTGSSPRTWGTPPARNTRGIFRRFIPTYMGNAFRSGPSTRISPVHPHVHGERPESRVGKAHADGSSPRTWGTRSQPVTGRRRPRFIPTYMGNALCRRPKTRSIPVHPHVHGERASGGRV